MELEELEKCPDCNMCMDDPEHEVSLIDLSCMQKKEITTTEKRFGLSIQANKTYPGKLVVQEGTENEIVQGIKEILETHSSERHHTRINIWNHSVAEKSEEELREKYGLKSMYHLVDRDDCESYSIFKSVLDCDTIRQIEEEATVEFQKENSPSKTEIFFEILDKKDPNYEAVHIQEIDI